MTESVFICVQLDGKTLIGDRKIGDDWTEYYSQLFNKHRPSLPVRYDDQSIWVIARASKEIHFDQTYDWDLFESPTCTAEIHQHMLKSLGGSREA